eukprot:TRINITY_DN808_c0_g1_i2.p1 TRINITY_DN808_c0_g1~~TRINITY_DN808_c0_g1_i2.p1  ORF type:complete len:355 (+),score=75.58 TRINITY_DN808_c0_g1_i2:114-1178(+)
MGVRDGSPRSSVDMQPAPSFAFHGKFKVLDLIDISLQHSTPNESSSTLKVRISYGKLVHQFKKNLEGGVLSWSEHLTYIVENINTRLIIKIKDKQAKIKYLGTVDLYDDIGWGECLLEKEIKSVKNSSKPSSLVMTLKCYFGFNGQSPLCDEGLPSKTFPVRLKTGDLLLFSSTRISSIPAKLVINSSWDHVGLAVLFHSSLFSFESTNPDGVGFYLLDERMIEYFKFCNVAVRRLKTNCGAKEQQIRTRKLHKFMSTVIGKPYETDMLLLLKTVAFQDFEEKSKKTSTYFCSELVAAAYQQYGVLDPNVSPSSFSPKDFGEDKLPFVYDCQLGPPIAFESKLVKTSFKSEKKT